MDVTLHGTGAGLQSADRSSSCATIRSESGRVACLDAGEGATRRMLSDGIDPNAIDLVLVSHSHADHWSGLPGLVAYWGLTGRSGTITIGVPPNGIGFFRGILEASYIGSKPIDYRIQWRLLSNDLQFEYLRIRPVANNHLRAHSDWSRQRAAPYPSFSYVLELGRKRALFTQDIGSEDDVADLMEGCSTVVCESAHVDPNRLCGMAERAGVECLIFTHIPPNIEGDLKSFAWPGRIPTVSIAHDGFRLTL